MATRQIVADAYELQVLLLGTLNLAAVTLQNGDIHTAGTAIARAAELYPALKEAITALPKPTNQATNATAARN